MPESAGPGMQGGGLYEQFGEEARRLIEVAQQEARLLRHVVVTPEHLLLAFLEPTSGNHVLPVLASLGASQARARALLGPGPGGTESTERPVERLPLTASARLVLDVAGHEAVDLHDAVVLPHHILLALLAQPAGPGAELVRKLGIEPERLRSALLRRLVGGSDEPEGRGRRQGIDGPSPVATPPPLFGSSGRRAVAAAEVEARRRGHGHLGTGHLLLGLLAEADEACRGVLGQAGVTSEGVLERLDTLMGSGWTSTTGDLPWTPRARRVLARALDAAAGDGVRAIEAHHVLLGLLGDESGEGARALGVDPADIGALRRRIAEACNCGTGPATAP